MRGLFICLLVTVLKTEVLSDLCPSGDPPPSPCPADLTGIDPFMADPGSCDHFYHCGAGGQVFCQECPASLYFNEDLNICDWQRNVRCIAGRRHGQSEPEETSPEIIWNVPEPKPQPGDEINCGSVSPLPQCPPEEGINLRTYLPHPGNQRCYFICYGQRPQMRHCPGDLRFDSKLGFCT